MSIACIAYLESLLRHELAQHTPDVAKLSIALGAVELSLTSKDVSKQQWPQDLQATVQELDAAFEQWVGDVTTNAALTAAPSTAAKVKAVADAVWSKLNKGYSKDLQHAQHVYSFAALLLPQGVPGLKKQLDCAGVVTTAYAACHALSRRFPQHADLATVRMQVSEDHCWVQLAADGGRLTSVEVTTDTPAKRGLPVAADAWSGWLYCGGHAVLCTPHQALAALVASLNPAISGGRKGSDSEHLQAVQLRLLEVLLEVEPSALYPAALCALADLKEVAAQDQLDAARDSGDAAQLAHLLKRRPGDAQDLFERAIRLAGGTIGSAAPLAAAAAAAAAAAETVDGSAIAGSDAAQGGTMGEAAQLPHEECITASAAVSQAAASSAGELCSRGSDSEGCRQWYVYSYLASFLARRAAFLASCSGMGWEQQEAARQTYVAALEAASHGAAVLATYRFCPATDEQLHKDIEGVLEEVFRDGLTAMASGGQICDPAPLTFLLLLWDGVCQLFSGKAKPSGWVALLVKAAKLFSAQTRVAAAEAVRGRVSSSPMVAASPLWGELKAVQLRPLFETADVLDFGSGGQNERTGKRQRRTSAGRRQAEVSQRQQGPSNASNRRGAPPLAGNSARKKLLVAPLRSNSNTTEPTDMISEAEKFVLGMSSDAAAAAAESAPLPPPMQLEDQLAMLRSQATELSRRIDAQYSGVFVGVALPHAEGGAAADSDTAQLELRTALPDPAELSEASFGELGRSVPKLVAALIQAKERSDPQGWLAFQTEVSSLKLQRNRLEREAEDVAAVLEAARQRERRAGEYNAYEEAVGDWDGAQEDGGSDEPLAGQVSKKQSMKVVLITGFESFNVELYKKAAVALARACPGISLRVFSDRDLGPRREEVDAALQGADVFFSSLIFDFDQVEWLRSHVQSVPVRLVFESSLELMESTQVGGFKMAPGGKSKGPPPAVKKVLSLFGSGREEDKMKVKDLRTWLTAYSYWNQGGLDNVVSMFLYIAKECFGLEAGSAKPKEVIETPATGCLHPAYDGYFATPAEYMRWYEREGPVRDPAAPTVGILLYRKHVITEQPYIAQLIECMEQYGLRPLPIFINGVEAHTVVRDSLTTTNEQQLLRAGHQTSPTLSRDAVMVDAIVNTVGFPLVGGPAGTMEGGRQSEIAKTILGAKNVPYVVAAPLLIQDMASWVRDGIGGLQSVVLYSLPELDGAIDTVPLGGLVGDNIFLVPERVKRLANRLHKWVALRRTPPQERKLAILVYGFPPGVGATGTAALLNVPKSLESVLAKLREVLSGETSANSCNANAPQEGYDLGELGEDLEGAGEAIVAALTQQDDQRAIAEGAAGVMRRGAGEAERFGVRATAVDVEARQLKEMLTYPSGWGPSEWGPIPFLPDNDILVRRLEKQWGELGKYRGLSTSARGDSVVSGLQLGNVWIGVQPMLGVEGDPMRLLFERDLTPHPQYAAFYKWLQQDFEASAVLHLGMHGTVEWLPGVQLGNTGFSWSDVLLGDLPNVYVYACNNPSESIIAKRRGYGTIVSYNVPPYGRAGLYKQLSELKGLLSEYRENPEGSDALKGPILELLASAGLQEDCPFEPATAAAAAGEGSSGQQHAQQQQQQQQLRAEDADAISTEAFSEYASRVYQYLQVLENRLFSEGLHVLGQAPPPEQAAQYLSAYFGGDLPAEAVEPPPEVRQDKLEEAVAIRDLLALNSEELRSVVRALNGEYILPEAGGDLLRDGAGVLPTGRNIHAMDPYRMPSLAALDRGTRAAAAILDAHREASGGEWPETVAVNLWGLDAIKTKGESVAIALHLVGARPVKEGTGRIARFELVPLAEMGGRPRVDVLCNMSGIFRDSFQNVVELLDDCFQRAADADEPPELNFIRKHALAMKAQGLSNPAARLFSNPAGDYGSMVNERVGASTWEDGDELGNTWASRNAFSYGRGGERGTARPEVLQELLKTTDRVVQEIDSVEYGLTDIQEYYANTGALKRAAQAARPGAKVGCSIVEAFSKDVRPRELEEVLRLEYRSKLLNPKWAQAMAAQGSGGAFEISQRMTAMVGWGATTDFREDWTWDQAAETYVFDAEMAAKLRKSNPQAFGNVLRRMLEAAGRGMWNADAETLARLQKLYAEMDDELEGVRRLLCQTAGDNLLSGKTVLVTGASRGVGELLCCCLARHGAKKLIMVAEDMHGIKQTQEKCKCEGDCSCECCQCDMSDLKAVQQLAGKVAGMNVDVAIFNAGIFVGGEDDPLRGNPDDFDRMMMVNATAPMRLIRALAPKMVDKGEGMLICIGDVEAVHNGPKHAAYSASKYALRGFCKSAYEGMTEAFAAEICCLVPSVLLAWQALRPHNVRVMHIAVGNVGQTAMAEKTGKQGQQGAIDPHDVAEAVLLPFRCSSNCVPEEIVLKARAVPAQAFFGLFSPRKAAEEDPDTSNAAVERLLTSIEGSERGLCTANGEAVLAAAMELAQLGIGQTNTDDRLSATWRLLWTTEKETLFILKRAPWLRTAAGDVFQVIDVESASLQNVITFPPEGAFVVNSSIEVVGPQRTSFQFTSATLQLPKDRKLQLPPFGAGWFDTVYMDDEIRVAQDSRGDILIAWVQHFTMDVAVTMNATVTSQEAMGHPSWPPHIAGVGVPGTLAIVMALSAVWLLRNWSTDDWATLPGPPQGSWLTGHLPQLNTMQVHRYWQDCVQQYGGLFKVRILHMRVVVVSDPLLVQTVISRGSDLPKASQVYDTVDELFSPKGIRSFFNTHSYDDWKVVRKVTAPAFSPASIRKAFPVLLRVTNELCDVLAGKVAAGQDVLEMSEAAMRVTLDVIGSTGYGYDFKARTYAYCEMFEIIPPLLGEFTLRSTNPLRSLMHRCLPFLPVARTFRQRVKACHRWWEVLAKSVRAVDLEKAAAEGDTSLRVCLAQLPFDDDHLMPNIAAYLIAGFETTAHSIAWALYEIASDPAVQQRVEAELASAGLLGPAARQLEYGDLTALPFLNCVLKESMRLHPVASNGTIRVATRDLSLGGYRLARGTLLWVPFITVLTSNHNWERGEDFWPERWEMAVPQEAAAGASGPTAVGNAASPAKTYLPFSDGPRNCIGQNLALMEARAVLASMVSRFTLEVAPEMGSREDVRADEVMKLTLQCGKGIRLKLKLRQNWSTDDWATLPGPPQGSWLTGHLPQLNTPQVHRFCQECAQKYGGIFKLRLVHMRVVVVSDPLLVQTVVSHGGGLPKAFRLYNTVDELFSPKGIRAFFNTHSYDVWQVVRKVTAPAFSPANVRKAFPVLLRVTNELCDVLAGKVAAGKDVVEMSEAAMRVTLDVLGPTAYGYDFKARTYAYCEMFEIIPPLLGQFTLRSTNPLRPLMHRCLPFLPAARKYRQRVKACHGWWEVLAKSVRAVDLEKAAAEGDTSLRVCLAQLPFDDDHLMPNIAAYLIAGFETTAHSIAWALYEIASDPKVQQRVEAELAAAGLLGPAARQLEYGDLTALPFLNCVLKESMRLHPVASNGTIRVATRDLSLGGYRLARGTLLWVPLITVLTSNNNWERGEDFWPERWEMGVPQLGASGASGPTAVGNAASPAKTYLPFSDGPRNCIGQNLALMEARAVLASMVSRFTLEVAPEMGSREDVRADEPLFMMHLYLTAVHFDGPTLLDNAWLKVPLAGGGSFQIKALPGGPVAQLQNVGTAAIHVEVRGDDHSGYNMVAFLEPEQTVPVGSNTRFFVSGMQATTTYFVTDKAPVEAVAPSTAKRQVPVAASDGSKRMRVGSPGEARGDVHDSSDPADCIPDVPMHLMWVRGLSWADEGFLGVRLKDLLRGGMLWCLVSNYMLDFRWLLSACPELHGVPRIVLVHGEKPGGERARAVAADAEEAGLKDRTVIHAPPLPISYGTHHSKFFWAEYSRGLRVIICTANAINPDCNSKTQGLYWQDFPLKDDESPQTSPFQQHLAAYMATLRLPPATQRYCRELLDRHDFMPGYHQGSAEMMKWGHPRLRALLNSDPPFPPAFKGAPLVAQYSSMGSVDEAWLTGEFRESLAAGRCSDNGERLGMPPTGPSGLHLVWPTVVEVRNSMEGWFAGGSIPGPSKNVNRPFLRPYFCRWGGEVCGRQRAMPHIKTYLRYRGDEVAWLYVGSHNLSKAAWGQLQKHGSQLMVRSYELGVLLVPSLEAAYRASRWHGFSCTSSRPWQQQQPQQQSQETQQQQPQQQVQGQQQQQQQEQEQQQPQEQQQQQQRQQQQPEADEPAPPLTAAEAPARAARTVRFVQWQRGSSQEAELDASGHLRVPLPIPYSLPPQRHQADDDAWTVDVLWPGFYIVRVDAPPAVSTITTTADGCFVTVESGPHGNLALALDALQHPTQRAYMLPDIVFLPTAATVYALNEPVPTSKPRLVVSAETVAQARGQQQPASQNWQHSRHGTSHARSTQRRAGSVSRDDGSMPLSPPQTTAAAAAARLPMTPVRWPGLGGMQEGVGSPPAPIQQQQQQQLLPPQQQEHFVPVFPTQLGEHGGSMVIPPLMGHLIARLRRRADTVMARNRADILQRQLQGPQAPATATQLTRQPTSAHAVRQLPRFDVTLMEHFLDNLLPFKAEVYELFRQHPELLVAEEEGLSKEEHRELVRRSLRAILAAGYSPMSFFARDHAKYFYLAELLSLVDLSLTVKLGVQYSLWGGSVINLGTERHRKKYFDDIDRFRLPGCFAMTELKHGSNVAGLQTEAILDVHTDEWIVNTPDDGAIKWWIGNAAEDGRMATVFARLKVPAPDGSGALDDHGVHAFIVPLRDDAGGLWPGVEIHDCGYKVGLNGIDNGAIRFSSVRVPRDNLLDRFATVDRSGRYSSPMTSATKRFAATLGELTGGRVGLTCASVGVLKGSLMIAIRYGAQRQQFGPPDAPEIAVLDYPSQQQKLMPMLATCYALNFTKSKLVEKYCEMKRTKDEALVADVHSLSAGLKAYTTSYTNTAIGICRECCGGHGYAAVNRLGALRSDHDIFQTFEGDNTVLLQQVAALLLKEYRDSFRGSTLAATWSYLKIWAQDSLPANPLVTHETDVTHLRDPAFLLRALRYRSARLLHTLATRLRKHSRRSGEFAAWNKCLLHVLALSRAHIESVMLVEMLAAVDACVDPDCRRSLKALADLFALDRIYNDIIFRNDDYIAPEKAKAIYRLIGSLCGELRGVAVPLVDAFAIPDHILRAPIGLSTAGVDPYSEYLAAAGFDA
ncbi:Acyl-coenzyme A oxidase [Chlorella vulgaris]